MNAKQALNRIYWRFGGNGNTKPFPVNQMDVDAYNALDEYFDQSQTKQFEANELFAKLFLFVYKEFLEHYKTTVYDKNVRKEIGEILSKPLTQLIQELQESLNQNELYELFKDAGTSQKLPYLKTEKEKEHDKAALSNVKIKDVVECVNNEKWDYNTVKTSVMAEINNIINIHK